MKQNEKQQRHAEFVDLDTQWVTVQLLKNTMKTAMGIESLN